MNIEKAYKLLKNYADKNYNLVFLNEAIDTILKFVDDKMKTRLEIDCPKCRGTGKTLK